MSTTAPATKKETPATPVAIPPESAIAKREGAAAPIPMGERGVVIKTFQELRAFADLCVAGGMAPKGMSGAAAAVAIQAGLERGLGLLGGLQQCVVINGNLGWRGQAAFALVLNSGKCVPGTLKMGCIGEGEDMRGWAEGQRIGYAEPKRVEFSVKDARTAGLWGKEGPWKQYPKRQLQWRAFGFLARDLWADVLGGFPLADELYDHPEMRARVVSPPNEARALPPPPADDPLNELIFGGKKPAAEPAIIEAEVVREDCRNPTSQEVENLPAEPDDGLEDDDEPEPTHEPKKLGGLF